MKRIVLSVCLMACLIGSATAQDDPKKTEPTEADTKATIDRASYAIGRQIGQNLKNDNLLINLKQLFEGLSDGFEGKESKHPNSELQSALREFDRQMRTRQQEIAKVAADKNKKEGEAFLAANKKKPGVKVTKSGLQYIVLKAGNGATPKATDRVKTHYHGTLLDGTVFDSSVERGQPASFPVNRVIPGWTETLLMMKVGDKFRIFVPSQLAYGPRGAGGKIGPNSTLIFEVELLAIEQ